MYSTMSSSKCLQALVQSSARFRVAKPAMQVCTNSFGQRSRGFQTSSFVQSKITQNSWAADRFQEMGVKLPLGEALPETRLSTEALYSPSDKVLKLSDEFLSLNMVECVQLISEIQVNYLHPWSWIALNSSSFISNVHRHAWVSP